MSLKLAAFSSDPFSFAMIPSAAPHPVLKPYGKMLPWTRNQRVCRIDPERNKAERTRAEVLAVQIHGAQRHGAVKVEIESSSLRYQRAFICGKGYVRLVPAYAVKPEMPEHSGDVHPKRLLNAPVMRQAHGEPRRGSELIDIVELIQ